jgi:ribosome-binding ATPase
MLIGIVGKPNVGKSTFFKALTLANVESANYPFTTINPNSAIGYVKIKDPAIEFGKTSNPRDGFVRNEFRFVPVSIIDVAGLVPGAHEGKGLGNKFLDDLRQADVLIHVIDLSGSTNEKGEPCKINSYNPAEDIKFLEKELDLWFFSCLKKHWSNLEKKIRLQDTRIDEVLVSVLSGLNISILQINIALKELKIDKNNIEPNLEKLSQKLREISKPIIIVANKCDILEPKIMNEKLEKLKNEFPNYKIIPVVTEFEWNLKQADKSEILKYIPGENSFEIKENDKLNENQKIGLEKIKKYLNSNKTTGVQDAIDYSIFTLLQKKPIFPGGVSKLEDRNGNVLPDCFLMEKDATALDFAYKLHTDFGKNFIKAIDVKTKMLVGKEHNLKFGDIIEIVSGK